jgi:hypothetical protein
MCPVTQTHTQAEEENFTYRQLRPVVWELIPNGALTRQGPKSEHPEHRAYCIAGLAFYSPASAGTHFLSIEWYEAELTLADYEYIACPRLLRVSEQIGWVRPGLEPAPSSRLILRERLEPTL